MDFVGKNVHWLLPEEPSPCDILLHFRGQFAVAIPGGQAVSFKILEKLAKTQCSQIFIRASDQEAWHAWAAKRYPSQAPARESAPRDEEATQKQLYGNKRAELLSFVQKSLRKRVEDDPVLDRAFAAGLATMKKVVAQPGLDWYFKQFHEPPDLFHHNGRVAFALAVFCHLRRLAQGDELENIVYSALIHELEGSPAENMKTVASQRTLALLEANKDPVPKAVIQLIRMQDELCSGRGFPNNLKAEQIPPGLRAFTLFNHFDLYRLVSTGTRRARFDRTKQLMEARKADYDPDLFPKFWEFVEKQAEALP